ncbi:hypothetical protein ABZ477_04840 [Microbacterium sp. NPDC019599]|uniref:hypothetical protein n=1 Tax=Microbacterium sp. NPDC019599 TaxID=3154690 RepID=UPI0033DAEF29
MARIRRLVFISAAAGLLGSIVGCSGGGAGVSVPQGFDDLDQCPPRSIPVEDLREIGEPGCDLVGSSLTFPDGVSLPIYAVGEVFSSADSSAGNREHLIVNWGTPGVGALTKDGDELLDLWATSDKAEHLQREQAKIEGVRLD